MRLITILFLLSTLTLLNALDFSAEEKQWIKQNPVVTYVGDPAWLPYEGYDSNGNYTGFVPETLALISKQLPFNFKHIDTATWQESLDAIHNSKAMMISQSKYANALTGFGFTQTYFKNPIVFVMQKGERYVSSLHQIDEKRIGLINNGTTTPVFQNKYPKIKFKFFKNAQEGLEAVSIGKIDVFMCSLPRAGYEIAQNSLLNLRIVGKSNVESALGFGVKDSPILLSILNKIIMGIPENDVQDVLAKWSRQKYVEKVDYTLIKISIGISLFIILMILGFYLRLKHESQKRLAVQAKMLEQQAKMASMGEMMDAVAHQWKQPLNALSMYGELMKSDFDEGLVNEDYIKEMLDGVDTQINHMTTTLGEFRNFFRPNGEVVEFNLLEVINSVLFLVRDEFMKNTITIELNIDEEIRLKGNENEFKHLILNLINNAKDAFKDKEIKNRLIVIKAYREDSSVIITVEDSAGGINEAVIDSLFEANVTTKEKGKGTGIGLYMSAQIVQKMQGKIWVENINDGACFKIKFPL